MSFISIEFPQNNGSLNVLKHFPAHWQISFRKCIECRVTLLSQVWQNKGEKKILSELFLFFSNSLDLSVDFR